MIDVVSIASKFNYYRSIQTDRWLIVFGNVELSVSAVKFVSVSLVSSVIEVPDYVVSVELSSEDLHPKK